MSQTTLSATARKAGDSIQRIIRQKQQEIRMSKGNPKNARIQQEIAQLQERYKRVTEAAQQRVVEADRNQAEYRKRSGGIGASSEAIKQQEKRSLDQRAVEEGRAVYNPKTGGIDYKVQLQDSVKINDGVETTGGSNVIKRKVSDSVISNEGSKELPKYSTGPITYAEQIAKTDYKVKVGSPNVEAVLTLKEQVKPKSIGSIPLEAEQVSVTQKSKPEDFIEGGFETLKSYAEMVLTPKPIVSDILGTTDDEMIGRVLKRNEELLQPGPTFLGSTIQQAIEGKPIQGTGKGFYYDLGSISVDAAVMLAPTKKIPIKYEKFNVPGVTLKAGEKIVTPKSVSVGIGTKTKPIVSKTGGKVSLGSPKTEGIVTEVVAKPTTKKQQQRGIKLAADSTKYEQRITGDLNVISKVKGIKPAAVKKAENVKEIIKIGSKSKDPIKTKSFKDPVGPLTRTETKSITKSFKKQQTSLKGKLTGSKLSPYEGSASQMFFVKEQFRRSPGDFDFHVKSYELGKARVKQTIRETDANLTPVISEKTKATKIDKEGKKVAEFLNPKETDESGVLQMIEGDTLFTQKIPSKTYKTDEGITFGLQRQFLKKGESVFSLQPGGEIGPVSFRAEKDLADFWAIGKTKASNLLAEGKVKEAKELESRLVQFQKDYPIDYEGFFKKNKSFDVNLKSEEKSIPSKIVSASKDPLIGSSTVLSDKKITPTNPENKLVKQNVVNKPSSVRSSITGKANKKIEYRSAISKSSTSSIRTKPLIQKSNVLEYSKSTGTPKSTRSTLSSSSRGGGSSGSPGTPKSVTSLGSSVSSPGSPNSPGSPGSPGTPKGGSVPLRSSILSLKNTSYPIVNKKPIPIAAILWSSEHKKRIDKGKNKIYPFVGNVPLTEVVGVYKDKEDTVYGRKKVSAFEKFDVKQTKKRKSSKARNFLSL